MENKQKFIEQMKEIIEKYFGEPCSEYNADCGSCMARRTFNIIEELLLEEMILDKKKESEE